VYCSVQQRFPVRSLVVFNAPLERTMNNKLHKRTFVTCRSVWFLVGRVYWSPGVASVGSTGKTSSFFSRHACTLYDTTYDTSPGTSHDDDVLYNRKVEGHARIVPSFLLSGLTGKTVVLKVVGNYFVKLIATINFCHLHNNRFPGSSLRGALDTVFGLCHHAGFKFTLSKSKLFLTC
jgi:hypothetical protein